MEQKFREIYYQPQHYFKGKAAAQQLAKLSGYPEDKCQQWLDKQIIYQIYLAKPRRINRARFDMDKPNLAHQADLLFLPHDTIEDKTYKYALTVIDIASRYKAAYPLSSKNSEEVATAIEHIYTDSKLTWPKTICTDAGKEFRGAFTKLMTTHNVTADRAAAGQHRKQALVERFNRTLGEKLFTVQQAKEILKEARQEKDVRSKEWVNNLQPVIDELNNTKTRLIKMTPNEAMKLEKVKLMLIAADKIINLTSDQKVRYLLEPGELENDSKRRATDPVWSLKSFEIAETMKSANQPYLYRLRDCKKNKYFVKDELLIVPAESELPPDNIL